MNRNHRPTARRAFNIEPSPMQFGKLHRKGQPQTGALKAAGKAVIDLAEKFERPANLVAGHLDACVPHPKAKALSIGLGLNDHLRLLVPGFAMQTASLRPAKGGGCEPAPLFISYPNDNLGPP